MDFGAMPWERVVGGGAEGRVKRRAIEGNTTVRLLELDPRWDEKEWCTKRHVGYVLFGTLKLALKDRAPLVVRRGQGFSVPKGCAHKASCTKATRIFLVE